MMLKTLRLLRGIMKTTEGDGTMFYDRSTRYQQFAQRLR